MPTPDANEHIDPYLFDRHFAAFREFVEQKAGVPFISFASNPYTDQQEGYKADINRTGRELLAFQSWKLSDIGSGEIAQATIRAIEVVGSNLVQWKSRYGDDKRPHQPLYESMSQMELLVQVEKCLFALYRSEQDERSFSDLVKIFRKSYPLIAYLFFLKDRSRYLPIAPTSFDHAFQYLGSEFTTTRHCSWQNYSTFLRLIGEIKTMLSEAIAVEVTLLDAHSFAWMLSNQMKKQGKLPNVQDYLDLATTEREAIIKARIGQGQFRQSLIDYWSACAVTGCTATSLLRASHIKPWKVASLVERLNLFNGLLLSPALDACFDAGFISFDDDGNILISSQLKANDLVALGIHTEMRLKRVDTEHIKYLAFHRECIFKREPATASDASRLINQNTLLALGG